MSNFLFLTHRMSVGFGVSSMVEELCKALLSMRHSVTICSIINECNIDGVKIFTVQPDPQQILSIARTAKADAIIAFTSPFFEVLPALPDEYSRWAFECGDPSYQFFSDDALERQIIILNKQVNVYPKITGVLTISEFIRMDIEYMPSKVVYLGADHLPDWGIKTDSEISGPLKIGTLMRLGEGESHYKGNSLFMELCERIRGQGVDAECCIMGRGSQEDAADFQSSGFTVYRNATDAQRASYLRELDIFVSPSLWEGFNLPLAEAMKSGTLSLAFDTGAHPEVCPFIFSGVDEMLVFIMHHTRSKDLLLRNSERCYRYVCNNFTWQGTARRFLAAIGGR